MRSRIAILASVAVASMTARGVSSAQEAPAVELVAPKENAYISGPTSLEARVHPDSAASTVVFYADGKAVCTLTHAPFQCDWDAGPDVSEHEIRLVVNLAAGGRVVRMARTKGIAYADGRRFVRGLPESAFHLYEDGKLQAITHFASENVPLELLVAIDISGSMTPSVPKLQAAVKEFLTAVPARARVTLLAFNDTVFTLARQATAPAERVKAVDRLSAWGGTALYDVITRGIDLLGRQTGRKALIVFTDGEDQGSHVSLDAVERRLEASDVTLYMIGQGRGTELKPLETLMRRLAEPTGGRAVTTGKIDELHDAFTDCLAELSSQYLLGYAPPAAGRGAELHTIKVEVDGHYHVRARQAYRIGGQG